MKNRILSIGVLFILTLNSFGQDTLSYKVTLGKVALSFELLNSADGLSSRFLNGDTSRILSDLPISVRDVEINYVVGLDGEIKPVTRWSGFYNVVISSSEGNHWLKELQCDSIKVLRNGNDLSILDIEIDGFSNTQFVDMRYGVSCPLKNTNPIPKSVLTKVCRDGGILQFSIQYQDTLGVKQLKCGVWVEGTRNHRVRKRFDLLKSRGKLTGI